MRNTLEKIAQVCSIELFIIENLIKANTNHGDYTVFYKHDRMFFFSNSNHVHCFYYSGNCCYKLQVPIVPKQLGNFDIEFK